jgi:hypothetical protein
VEDDMAPELVSVEYDDAIVEHLREMRR